MAQALFERYAPEDVRAESAGSDPVRHVWPEVIEVMREVGIDLSANKPKRLSVEMQLRRHRRDPLRRHLAPVAAGQAAPATDPGVQ
jgi:hypothetical protein